MEAPSDAPEWKMRQEATEAEMHRRNRVIEMILKKTENSRANVESIIKDVEKNVAKRLEAKGIPPVVSANYFSWYVDRSMWGMVFKKFKDPPEFNNEPPKLYGTPYSQTYLAYRYEQDVDNMVARDLENLDLNYNQPATDNPALFPEGVTRHTECLKKLFKEMFPGRPYEEGCELPFTIRFPLDSDELRYAKCLGKGDGICDNLRKAAKLLGGGADGFVLIFAKSKDNPPIIHSPIISLDFDDSVDLKELDGLYGGAMKYRLRQAWFTLQSVYVAWLNGRNANMVEYIDFQLNYSAIMDSQANYDVVAEAIKGKRDRAAAHSREAHELSPNNPYLPRKYFDYQKDILEREMKEVLDEIDIAKSANLKYSETRKHLSDLMYNNRYCPFSAAERMGMVEEVAMKIVRVRTKYLIYHSKGSVDLFDRLISDFLIDERIWNPVLPCLRRFEICHRALLQSESMPEQLKEALPSVMKKIRVRIVDELVRNGIDPESVK